MKKILSLFTLLAIVLGLWAMVAPSAMAQNADPGRNTILNLEAGNITLASLNGGEDIVLRGPYDTYEVRFNTPSSWSLLPDASLSLNFNAAVSNLDGTSFAGSGATVEVSMNGYVLSTVFIDQLGKQTLEIPIPAYALISDRSDGRHELSFYLDASFDCRLPHESSVVIRSDSILDLPYEVMAPPTDLVILPRPIYQRDSFLPEAAILVVPDDPSVDELQAAMSVAAGFGRMTSGNLDLPLVTISALTEEVMGSSHLVVVGKPAGLGLLTAVDFPLPVNAGKVISTNAQNDDGVIEMGVSPWNKARVVLYVGGNNDAGVVKAAQALSYGLLQSGEQPSQTLISSINPDQIPSNTAVDRTLADLGYLTLTNTGIGTSFMEYHFIVPPGQIPGLDPYFDLVYTHSAFLDPVRSGLVIELNDQRIGSTTFSEDSSKEINSLRVSLPEDTLLQGDNKLVIRADLRPFDLCSDFISSNLWISVFSESLVHLPLNPAQIGTSNVVIDLSLYPFPFSSDPTMGSIGFVLSDPASWNVAAQISSELGQKARGQILNPSVVFASAIPDAYQENRDLIVIGQASNIPLIDEMSNYMPAPFEPGSDLASDRSLPISYRLPAGANIGYLELFSSPWDPNRTVLTVLGSSDEGLLWAANALYDPLLRGDLSGNFAIVNQNQVQSTDTRVSIVANLSATAVPGGDVLVADVSTVPAPPPLRLGWLQPAIIVMASITVLFILYLLIRGMRSRSKQ